MKKRKKKKVRALFLLLLLIALSIFGGIKGGKYLAYKLSKPIGQDNSALSGSKNESSAGKQQVLTDNDALNISAAVTEFIEAEHSKKTDKLTSLVSPDYYSTFNKSLKQLSTAAASVQNISFTEVSVDRAVMNVEYIKNGKGGQETVTMENVQNSWKVTNVTR